MPIKLVVFTQLNGGSIAVNPEHVILVRQLERNGIKTTIDVNHTSLITRVIDASSSASFSVQYDLAENFETVCKRLMDFCYKPEFDPMQPVSSHMQHLTSKCEPHGNSFCTICTTGGE